MQTPTRLELWNIEVLTLPAITAHIHPPEQIKALRESLREFEFVTPLLISADGTVIDGAAILEAAKAEGYTSVPCVIVDHLTETQRLAYYLACNKLAEMSHWDKSGVSESLKILQDAGFDLTLTGFTADDILIEPIDATEDDFDPTPPEIAKTKPGELYTLGDHRLLCGDATSEQDIARLCGSPCDMLLTDPPYNVDVTGGTSEKLKILGDKQTDSEFLDFLTKAFSNAYKVLSPGAPFYIWHPDGAQGLQFRQAADTAHLQVHQCLVWVKNQAVISRQDYHWQHESCLHGDALQCGDTWDEHESCLYGWTEGKAHLWCSDRRQTTVLEYDKPAHNKEHPTMKPVRLFAYQIENSTRPGARVLDPFGGSGTTLVACEQLERVCLIAEKDPRYCDVIINRWETLTGKKAVLLNA